MSGLARWWSRMPVAGRVIVGLLLAGVVFGVVAAVVDVTAGLMVLGILAVALGLFLLIRWFVVRREKRKGAGLAGKLWAGMSGGAGSGLDESTEELSIRQEMEGRWKKVYETLRERRYDYYSFPWYLILGAAQSGKTTTIQKSNQEFPIGDEPVVDYGGTKGCNWFFTNQGIIIDTAGRYVEHLGEDDAEWDSMLARDQEEWETFLKLLREGRDRSPINGVIITVKLEDVLETDARRRKKVTDAMRKALLDIEEKLAVRVPVYVLVTMCDLLVGFVDYFANLPGLSDRTLFGWSRQAPYDKEFDAAEFGPAFSDLSAKVDGMMLDFLEAQAARGGNMPADVTRMDRMMAFPDEFRALGEPLQQLLAEVFKKSAYNEQHFVRGVYFTSGVQEGRPVRNACLSLVGDGANGFEEEDVSLVGDGNKAYFIADLYEEKVFKEAGLVRMTRRAQSAQRLKKFGYTGVAAAIAIAMGLWVAMEIAAINSLELFPPERLRELTRAEVTAATLRDQAELFGGADGLSGLAAAVDEMGQEPFTSASWLGRENVDAARESLHEAYRKLYATKAFDPLVAATLDEWSTREPVSWSECARLTDVLLGLRALGKGDGDLETLRDVVLPGLDALAPPDETLDFDLLDELTEALADGDKLGLAHVRVAAAERLDDIDAALRGPVIGWWNTWLDDVTKPLARQVGSAELRPDLDDLVPFWSWQGMKSLDDELAGKLDELTKVLEDVDTAPAELTAFRQSVTKPWRAQFDHVSHLRTDLAAHLDRLALPLELGPEAAHQALVARLKPLASLGLETRQGSADQPLREAIEALDERLDGLDRKLRTWAKPSEPSVVTLNRSGTGLAQGAAAVAGTESGLSWTPRSQLTEGLWSRLQAIDGLVGYDPAKDPAARPDRSQFWGLASDFDGWFRGDGADDAGIDGTAAPRSVKDLVHVAGDAGLLTTLRKRRFDAFAEHLTDRLDNEDDRVAFLAQVDAEALNVRGLTAVGLDRRFMAQTANADVAAELVAVVHTLRTNLPKLTRGHDLDRALGYLLESYAQQHLVDFWTGDALLALGRDMDLLPAPAPAGWEAFVAWQRGLPDVERSLGGFSTLARFAAAQPEGTVKRALSELQLSDLNDDFAPAQRLWERYGTDAGSVERVSGVASQLSRAMAQLAALDTEEDFARLERAQRGGSIYDGLMAPQRLHEAWAAEGLDDPLVDGLVDLAASVRATLGQLASQLFRQQWFELGDVDGPAHALQQKFPFRPFQLSSVDDENLLAGWDETRAFFEDPRFQQLVSVIYRHVDPPGPDSDSLYTIDFGSETLGREFKRCVQLAELCGLGGDDRRTEVRVELFDGVTFEDSSPNDWIFELGQSTPHDNVEINMPFEDDGITGDAAPRWIPGRSSHVRWKEPEIDSELGASTWVYDAGPLARKSHWLSVLMFVYATQRGTPEDGLQAPDDVRWIEVKLKKKSRTAMKVIGVRMEGMPDELPDLHEAFKQG